MSARCKINTLKSDSTAQVELLQDEIIDSVDHSQPFGFHSLPASGDGILLKIGGKTDDPVLINVDSPDRADIIETVGLKSGEVLIYSSDKIYIKFTADGIEIKTDKLEIEVDGDTDLKTDLFTIDGDVEVTGTVKAGATKVNLGTHGHTTVLGPTIPPVIPELG